MIGMLSPVMKQVVEEEASYPSPSVKTKLNKAIGRYKLLSEGGQWKDYLDDIKFALADLLVARGEEKDYKEALNDYNHLIAKTKNSQIKGRAMIGKAELVIAGAVKMDVDDAVTLCKQGFKLLKGDLRDFFVAKGIAVEAELLIKKSGAKNIKQAGGLFNKLIAKKNANPYFRARAMAGKAELILYFGIDKLSAGIKMCEEAVKILADRPLDYFAVKAKVVEAEMLARRGSSADLEKAETLCNKVIMSASTNKDLAARAKLVLGEISKKDRAEKLFEEVLELDDIDPYLIDKARTAERSLKTRVN